MGLSNTHPVFFCSNLETKKKPNVMANKKNLFSKNSDTCELIDEPNL